MPVARDKDVDDEDDVKQKSVLDLVSSYELIRLCIEIKLNQILILTSRLAKTAFFWKYERTAVSNNINNFV